MPFVPPRLVRAVPKARAARISCLLATSVTVFACAGKATAEPAVPTTMASVIHAEFLLDAPPPPPPYKPAAVCVVDTGVDINPDTQAAVVAARYAYDGDAR